MTVSTQTTIDIPMSDIMAWLKSLGVIPPITKIAEITEVVINPNGGITINCTGTVTLEEDAMLNTQSEKEKFLSLPISKVVMKALPRNALLKYKLHTMRDVLNAFNENPNLKIRNFGQIGIAILKEVFSKHEIAIQLPGDN